MNKICSRVRRTRYPFTLQRGSLERKSRSHGVSDVLGRMSRSGVKAFVANSRPMWGPST